MYKAILIFLIAFISISTQAQNSVFGKWVTIDDETNEKRSVVEIYERKGKVYGKIVKIYPIEGEDPDPVCNLCPQDDSRYNEKIIGMEIIKDLVKNGDDYEGGTVLKPDEGRIFKCKVWLDEGELFIRGYWGIFYRTQRWQKYQ